ncbi:uncharacterized protein LOC135811974 isoform X1 [Sycon ciliatum]|uniref:uncharacterized protein LOC135811974 isoform X1 n=1 Tax=Sycon ciliatum TaxID=27933 RepID=UPI0031F679EC
MELWKKNLPTLLCGVLLVMMMTALTSEARDQKAEGCPTEVAGDDPIKSWPDGRLKAVGLCERPSTWGPLVANDTRHLTITPKLGITGSNRLTIAASIILTDDSPPAVRANINVFAKVAFLQNRYVRRTDCYELSKQASMGMMIHSSRHIKREVVIPKGTTSAVIWIQAGTVRRPCAAARNHMLEECEQAGALQRQQQQQSHHGNSTPGETTALPSCKLLCQSRRLEIKIPGQPEFKVDPEVREHKGTRRKSRTLTVVGGYGRFIRLGPRDKVVSGEICRASKPIFVMSSNHISETLQLERACFPTLCCSVCARGRHSLRERHAYNVNANSTYPTCHVRVRMKNRFGTASTLVTFGKDAAVPSDTKEWKFRGVFLNCSPHQGR